MAQKGRKGRSTRNEDGSPNPVDVHVGGRVRLRRLYMDLSQSKLARELGLTFQQIQKYERGLNRISASRLYDLSRVLEVPVSFFFDDMPEDMAREKAPGGVARGVWGPGQQAVTDPMSHRETIDLVRAYYSIADPAVRKRIYEITKALAAAGQTSASTSGDAPLAASVMEENKENNGAENGC